MSTNPGVNRCKSVVVKLGPDKGPPWWLREVKRDPELCDLHFEYVPFRGKRLSKEIHAFELPFFVLRVLPVLLRLRQYDYMYTFENSLITFALSLWQTLLRSRKPRHVVLQFIMREKTSRLASRLKYAFMKWCFSSIHVAVCSSRVEAEYYRGVFRWPPDKTAFVPLHSSADFLSEDTTADSGFILAGGRVFRDFATLISAVRMHGYPCVIVAPHNAVTVPADATNITLLEEIPQEAFTQLVRSCAIVVLPLHDVKISAGQIVLLQAMAMGKAVIATRTAGTVDYLVHGENGLLVDAKDPASLAIAIETLMSDTELRHRLGAAARTTIARRHLPQHYAQQIRREMYRRRAAEAKFSDKEDFEDNAAEGKAAK